MALNSPGPDINFPFTNPNGTLTRTAFELLLSIFSRTGGSDGGDLSALKALLDEAVAAINASEGEIHTLFALDAAAPNDALSAALMARILRLEAMVMDAAPVPRPVAPREFGGELVAMVRPASTPDYPVYSPPGQYLMAANNLGEIKSAATARTNLGLGTMAPQNANAVAITGGSVSASAAALAMSSTNTGGGGFQYQAVTAGATFPAKWGVNTAGQLIFNTNNATALTLDGSGNVLVPAGVTTGSTVLHTTSVALANAAAAAAATLTNAPVAGNPTKWVAINDNGTTRHLPLW